MTEKVGIQGNIESVTCSGAPQEAEWRVTVTAIINRTIDETTEVVVLTLYDANNVTLKEPVELNAPTQESPGPGNTTNETWQHRFDGVSDCPHHAEAIARISREFKEESNGCQCT